MYYIYILFLNTLYHAMSWVAIVQAYLVPFLRAVPSVFSSSERCEVGTIRSWRPSYSCPR